ncbi:ClbS/DfsB family four-helix bundle protein [Streptomyces sp. NBC_01724]|uniref:hypothetical protein n=1 Tax=Streptomyces sp. NBC_01724 TaxID=2975922 RepID=UPI002E33C5A7|nr:hypothetical protein [Streptomyces sp. NBC_01724]
MNNDYTQYRCAGWMTRRACRDLLIRLYGWHDSLASILKDEDDGKLFDNRSTAYKWIVEASLISGDEVRSAVSDVHRALLRVQTVIFDRSSTADEWPLQGVEGAEGRAAGRTGYVGARRFATLAGPPMRSYDVPQPRPIGRGSTGELRWLVATAVSIHRSPPAAGRGPTRLASPLKRVSQVRILPGAPGKWPRTDHGPGPFDATI